MTLQDIAQLACETTGDISSDALDHAKRKTRLKYATLYDAHNWREAMRTIDGVALDPTLNGKFFLPYDAEEVIYCSLSYDGANYIRLTYRERDWIERFYAPNFALPGRTPWFFKDENLAWPALNPGKFTFTTSDKSPFNLFIAGRNANDWPINEQFSMQGVVNPDNTVTPSSITTVNSYKVVTVLSKDITTTPLVITPQVGTALQIPQAMTELVFSQFDLYPIPIFADPSGNPLNLWIRMQVKLKVDPLNDDYSVPRISHIWDALVSFTTAAMYRRLQQVSKAQEQEQEALEHIKAAVNVEKNQSEFRQQVVPTAYEHYSYMDWAWARATSYDPFAMR